MAARIGAILAVALIGSSAFADVRVRVSASTAPGGATTYSYVVENATAQPVVSVRIGFGDGQSQLRTAPEGWTFTDGVPATSASAPQGWTPRLVTTEESSLYDFEWSSDEGPQFDVPAGATAAGFSVRTPVPAPEYMTSKFDVTLGNGTHVAGTIEPFDTTPPRLTVTLSPAQLWPPDRKLVNVTATVAATDDVDANPAVRLVSITANETVGAGDVAGAAFGTDDRSFDLRAERSGQEKTGRIYTVTYSATDSSGNTATATATAVVPHDVRR